MEILETIGDPELLFHYTSMETLCNMLNVYKRHMPKGNLTFWASSIFTMNDPREMKHGKDVLERLLPTLEKLFMLPPENRLEIQALDTDKILKDITKTPFVLSFTANYDDLSMWNLYGDSGRGISLILSKELNPYPINGIKNSDIVKVNYKKGINNYPNLADIFNKGIIEWRSYHDPNRIKECKERTLSELFTQLCPYIKSEAYEKENEYRICYTDVPYNKVYFRVKSNCIIPYIEVPIPIKYIKGILLGPCCNHELTEQSLRFQLNTCGIDIDIIKSDIPYRKI